MIVTDAARESTSAAISIASTPSERLGDVARIVTRPLPRLVGTIEMVNGALLEVVTDVGVTEAFVPTIVNVILLSGIGSIPRILYV